MSYFKFSFITSYHLTCIFFLDFILAIYIIPVSPLFPFFGTILQGSNFALNALMNSDFEWQNCIYQQTILGGNLVVKLNRLLGRFVNDFIDSSADI